MPTREYHCGKCGHDFKQLVFQGDDEAPQKCPECGHPQIDAAKPPPRLFNGIANHSDLAEDSN